VRRLFPERRRRRRFVTLKNAGIAAVALVVAFGLLSVWSALRPHSRGLNNIFSRADDVSESAPIHRDPMIVHEGWIDPDSRTDSLLLTADAVKALGTPASPATATAVEQPNFEPKTSKLGKGQRITISGGSEGVEVHSEPMPIKVPPR